MPVTLISKLAIRSIIFQPPFSVFVLYRLVRHFQVLMQIQRHEKIVNNKLECVATTHATSSGGRLCGPAKLGMHTLQ